MRKLLLIMLIALSGIAKASTVQVSGFVSSDNNQPVSGQMVMLTYRVYLLNDPTNAVIVADTVGTDLSGYYMSKKDFPFEIEGGFVIVSTPNYCDLTGALFTETLYLSKGNDIFLNKYFHCTPSTPTCNADFTIDQHIPNEPSTAYFAPVVMDPNRVYEWSFGDGQTLIAPYVSHLYSQPGSYLVCLTVSDPYNGCFNTSCDTVVIKDSLLNPDPIVNVMGYVRTPDGYPIPNQAVTITYFDSLGYNPQTGRKLYLIFQDVTYTDASGLYYASKSLSPATTDGSVTISTENCMGGTNSENLYFELNNLNLYKDFYCNNNTSSCDANFSSNQYNSPNEVWFTPFMASYNSNYIWDFGDGTTSNDMYPYHAYANPGMYSVCLTVSNPYTNCYNTACYPIFIGSSNPDTISMLTVAGNVIANGYPVYNQPVTLIYFDSLAYNPQTGTKDYLVFADVVYTDYQGHYTSSRMLSPNTTNGTVEIYTADCANSTASDVLYFDWSNLNLYRDFVCGTPAPVAKCNADFVYYGDSLGGNYYNFMSTEPYNNLSYTWDFHTMTGTENYHTIMYGPNVYHQFATSGTHYVCLTVTNPDGSCAETKCQWISKIEEPGLCEALYTAFLDDSISQQGGSLSAYFKSNIIGNQTMNYIWDFGDNTIGYGMSAYHTFPAPGIYNICLTITDPTINCNSTYCASVEVDGIVLRVLGIEANKESIAIGGVYPNPASNQTTVKINADYAQDIQVILRDMTGKQVYKETQSVLAGDNTIQVELANMPDGLYLIEAYSNTGKVSAKMIKRE